MAVRRNVTIFLFKGPAQGAGRRKAMDAMLSRHGESEPHRRENATAVVGWLLLWSQLLLIVSFLERSHKCPSPSKIL